jgi:hypothetical protein
MGEDKKIIYYICDRVKKVEHCKTHCYHGKPHLPDQCTKEEVCYIGSKKGVVVKCKPATKKELAKYAKEQEQEKIPVKPWH